MGIALAAAYGLGICAVIWFAVDSARIPPMIWYWSGFSRLGWWGAMLFCLAAAGIPAVIAAFVWRFGAARKVLRLELNDVRAQGRAAREARIGRSPESVA